MFEKEIKFISDYSINKVRNEGQSITFEKLSRLELHPAILQFISAELDYLINDDRKRLLQRSLFDYSGSAISKYFNLISQEIKKTKKIPVEDILKLIMQATSFNANYVCRPRWTLMKLIFNDAESKNIEEIKQLLNYVYYYEYLRDILGDVLDKLNSFTISSKDFENLIKKIDQELFSVKGNDFIENAIHSIADFYNEGESSKNKVPFMCLETFLREKFLTDYITKIKEVLPVEVKPRFTMDEYKDALVSLSLTYRGTSSEAEELEPSFDEMLIDTEMGYEENMVYAPEPLVESEPFIEPEPLTEPEPEQPIIPEVREEIPVVPEERLEEIVLPETEITVQEVKAEEIKSVEVKEEKIESIQEEVKPEPVKEEIKLEPVKEEIKPEPVKPEPIKEEVIKEVPKAPEVKVQPVKPKEEIPEPEKVEVKQEPIKVEVKSETPKKSEPIKVEVKPEAPKAPEKKPEPPKPEIKRPEPPRGPEKKPEPRKEPEIKKQEVPKQEIKKSEPIKHQEIRRQEPPKPPARKPVQQPVSKEKKVDKDLPLGYDFTLRMRSEPEKFSISWGQKKSDDEDLGFEEDRVEEKIPPKQKEEFVQPEDKNSMNYSRAENERYEDLLENFSKKDIKKIIGNIFNEDEQDFYDTLRKISQCNDYQSSTEILKEVYQTYKVNPYSGEAIKLTNAVSNYFNQG